MQIAKGAEFCTFCGKTRIEAAALVGNGTGAFICTGCVHQALGVIEAASMLEFAKADGDDAVTIGQARPHAIDCDMGEDCRCPRPHPPRCTVQASQGERCELADGHGGDHLAHVGESRGQLTWRR